jgi:hypothetical protein
MVTSPKKQGFCAGRTGLFENGHFQKCPKSISELQTWKIPFL